MPLVDSRVHQVRFGNSKFQLCLREQRPSSGDAARPVLYVHGFTFPSDLSIFWEVDGRSWADALNEANFPVWGLDFLGFGGSSRYPEMDLATPPAGKPLGRVVEAKDQILCAAKHVLATSGAARLSVIAHSRGTIPAGLFATEYPDLIDRVVFFGPFAQRHMCELPYGLPTDPERLAPWRVVTIAAQHERFVEDVPAGNPSVLNEENFEAWATAYLATDPTSASRDAPSVKVPNGPAADVIEAWTGRIAYNPANIKSPLLVVRGEWDSLSNDDDAAWFMNGATASVGRRDVKLPNGTHLMLLENGCDALHKASVEFLSEP